MPQRLEIALIPDLLDAEGEGVKRKAADYFGYELIKVRTVQVVTIDAVLSGDQLSKIRHEVFTNPVTQVSSYNPLGGDFDWCVWVGFRPGVRDNPGATAVEAIEDVLAIRLKKNEAVFTSKRYEIRAEKLTRQKVERIARELLSNDIIQQWQVFSRDEWDPKNGIGFRLPKVLLNHVPTVTQIPIESDDTLMAVSNARNLALNPADIPTIRAYFLRESVLEERKKWGLSDPTDVELEYISQGRSDHCNHNTFRGLFHYVDIASGESLEVNSLFKTCIEAPTLTLKASKPWVISVLWDNAGVARFDENSYYTITGETHNSPSNMEAYGGAITGIVGIYRDPMGTGLGSRLIMGSYGFCVGHRDYDGELKPKLHPRRLLDGIIEGVRDGGNKSGIPTTFGQVMFHPGYMGKCLVFVTALGLMPAFVNGKPSEEKKILPGDRIIMCGGRVGKDGIHGVTASSEVFSESTPAGHVQIGDPYTQKKMQDFLLEARDEGLIRFITDNGGGGLSSSIGETARYSNGCHVTLEKVPLKYEGLDQWEIWVSESQERMTVAVPPEHVERFLFLSERHAVESTVIGTYTDSGKLHITYDGKTCAYVDLDLLTAGFPQWEFQAEWRGPEMRGLMEPVLSEPSDYNLLLASMLEKPNIASKEWICRQYDHEVQGSSVIKPLIGRERDIPSDAAVIRPVLESERGVAFAQALLPFYSQIDALHMTACTIDEAVRRLVAVGAEIDEIGGVDNFCWPSIQYHPDQNPDGKFKAAQLVRSCQALKDTILAYGIPLLSGKDSMYVDGHLPGRFGERHKVSGLETLQFSTSSVVKNVTRCMTLEPKMPGDQVYVVGLTEDELGGSEYYDLFGYVGNRVPKVFPERFLRMYRAMAQAIENEVTASVHGIYAGGFGVHLALMAMGSGLGLKIDLSKVPIANSLRRDRILFSESAGRFIVTVDSSKAELFEQYLKDHPFACVGRVTESPFLSISDGAFQNSEVRTVVHLSVTELRAAWKKRFGDLK